MGVQQAVPHPDCFNDGVKFIRAEAFDESFVERGDGVVDDLIGDR